MSASGEDSGDDSVRENPFSARHLRPGAIPYRLPPAKTLAALIDRLRQNDWRGQIVGPHGSGKSALVASLREDLRRQGKQTVLIELHDGQRRLPTELLDANDLTEGAILFVDGYEQLAAFGRFRLAYLCRRRALGLVVTTHRSAGFPDLHRTTTSLELAHQIARQLLGRRPSPVQPQQIDERFAVHRGNLREVLFDLYDLHQGQPPRPGDGTDSTASC